MATLHFSIICLSLVIVGLVLLVKKIDEDAKLNYVITQTICAYLHKTNGITVEEMKEVLDDYHERKIEYIQK